MKKQLKKAITGAIFLGFSAGIFSLPASGQTKSQLLDDFNRSNNVVVGAPAGNGTQTWLETETTGSNDYRIRTENNMLVMGSQNNAGTGSSGLEQISYNADGLYATTFNQASGNLTWSFNFRQSRVGLSGFGATTYGIAYVLGSTHETFTHPAANGYAIVMGNSGSPDPVRLVRFANGLTANSKVTDILAASTETNETAYYSIKVTFDPCSKSWSLQLRNDGSSGFADPATVTSTPLTATDQFFTNTNLNFTGAAYNHGTVSVTAFFDNISVPTATATAVDYVWTGAASTDFENPENWSPSRTCFRTSDKLHFDSGKPEFITNVTSQTFSSFWVKNHTVLTLTAKTGATQTLSILDGDNQDLLVESGSSLIIDSNDALEISLQAGATGVVAGNFTVQNTAMNLGRAHRLLAATSESVIFEPGSIFLARHLSGEPFGNSGAANTMIFRQNATYISRHGASPFGLASPNAKVVFETGSLYRHEQTGTAPRFDGRTYADFELNVASNLAIIFGTSALSPNRIDNFTISSGNMNITLSNGTNPLPLQITGNLSVAPGALLNYNPSSTANASTLTLAGTKQQTVSGPVYLGPYATLEINNPAGVVLGTALNINGGLQLSNGVLTVPAGTELNLEDNAVVSGGSAGSYVNGKMIKAGDDAFVFPVGKSGLYAPVAISAPGAVNDKFSAEYFPVNPTAIFGTAKNDSLAQISATEYWNIDRLAGTSEVKVSLSYDAARSLAVANPADLRIAHFKDNGWSNEGKAELIAEPQYLLVATGQPQASFSPFTFASVTTNNPLPVELLSFNARKTGATVQLTWETASEMNSDRFEIERSQDGRTFETIGSVKAAGHSNTVKRYAFEDKNPNSGLNYYRLKQADLDGSFAYSKVVSVTAVKKEIAISLYPNPARDVLIVSLPTNAAETTIQVYNAVGQEVRTLKTNAATTQLNVLDLPAGTYQVRIVNVNGVVVQKFVKSN